MPINSRMLHQNYTQLMKILGKFSLSSVIVLFGSVFPALAEPRYGVYVEGDSPLLLEIVQQVQPGAILQTYGERRIIDAGIYFNRAQAEDLVDDLKAQGVLAKITDFSNNDQFIQPRELVPLVIPPADSRIEPIETNIPPNFVPRTPNFGLYQVYVNSQRATINQVRQVSPDAFVDTYKGQLIILAGSLVNRSNAEKLVRELASRNIPASIIRSTSELDVFLALQPNVPNIPPSPPATNLGLANVDSYFVLIPGQGNELVNIANNVLTLGIPKNSILIRDVPVDSLVAVGPFATERLAQEWENYLKNSGLPRAKFYYGR